MITWLHFTLAVTEMLFTIAIGFILVGILYKWMQKDKGFLKGMPHPKEHLLLGSVLELKEMSSRPHLKLQEWANQLGDVYYFRYSLVFRTFLSVIY